MRIVMVLAALGLLTAVAIPAQADCICQSQGAEEDIVPGLSTWPSGTRGGGATEATIQLANGGTATTTADLILGGPPETQLSSGSLTLALSNAGPGLVRAQVTDLTAAANSFPLNLCSIGPTSWSDVPVGAGELEFNFNNGTINGQINLIVTGGINQKHINVDVTGTFDENAGAGQVAFQTTGVYSGVLSLPASCSVPTTNAMGGAVLAGGLLVLSIVVLQRRLA